MYDYNFFRGVLYYNDTNDETTAFAFTNKYTACQVYSGNNTRSISSENSKYNWNLYDRYAGKKLYFWLQVQQTYVINDIEYVYVGEKSNVATFDIPSQTTSE